jgi:hypothetical protein
MKRWQLVNLVTFVILIFATVSLVYVLGTMNFTTPFAKPWHLLPSVHEDSLSSVYKNEYQILGKSPLRAALFDSSRTNIFILVDAWGVPLQESILEEDLKVFKVLPHQFALHRRLANYTRHAEHAEFRNSFANSVFLFGGDSLQFNRQEYIPSLGFQNLVFCDSCKNEQMIETIDSLLSISLIPQFIAWTALASAAGDHDKIQLILRQIAELARKHPEVHFVVQGTHRPVLCDSNTRSSYKSHWVPVVILNP